MVTRFLGDLKLEFDGYNKKKLVQDIMAGLTVTAVALPLALAFGVSSGADAASGLITAIIAGILIGSLSGASFQMSGPTGAMTAILLTISIQYGINGVFIAGFLSGIMLIIAALLRFGRFVSILPSSVITGFTSGIAVIIALGQIDNFFGTTSKGSGVVDKLSSYGELGFSPNMYAIMFGILVIIIMMIWPEKWNAKFPSSLAGIIIALIVNSFLNLPMDTVGNIPRTLLPENRLILSTISFLQFKDLLAPALSIAMLGMIESLLCGVSAGKMKNEKLNPDRELMAQGIGNIVIPFFGGVPATAAIARTSVGIKSGGQTRLASIFHSVGLIISMFLLGPIMAKIPLSALAGVLMVTAWRMNEWPEIKYVFKNKFGIAMIEFTVTLIATVIFDLTIAILIGVFMATLLFVAKSCEIKIDVSNIDLGRMKDNYITNDHAYTKMVYLTGPLFFLTKDKFSQSIKEIEDAENIIFSMRAVTSIDQSAISAFKEIVSEFTENNVNVLFCGVQPDVREIFDRSGLTKQIGEDGFYWDAIAAIKSL